MEKRTSGAGETGQLRVLIEKHRRHVELSPGVGPDAQRYALGCFDDLLSDLPLVAASGETPPAQSAEQAYGQAFGRLDGESIKRHIAAIKRLSTPPATTALRGAASCSWAYDADSDKWDGSCGCEWVLIDGTPEENKMRFCPSCGNPIAALRTQEQS